MRMLFSLPSRASQWAVFLLSVIAATSVTFFLVSAINSVSQITRFSEVADAFQLKSSFIYTNFEGFSYPDEEKLAKRESMLSTDGVQDVNLVTTYCLMFPDFSPLSQVTLVNYDDTLLRDVRVRLTEGNTSLMGEKNQIFLPAFCRDACEVGDILSAYLTRESDGNIVVTDPVTVTVGGFLAEQPVLRPFCGGAGLSLAELFETQTHFLYNDIPIDDGIVWGLADEAGTPLPSQKSNMYIIRSDGSIPFSECKEKLTRAVESPALLHSGEDLFDRYIESAGIEIGMTFALLMTALVLSFTILTASTALELIYRQKEMAILYLSGASWNQCLWSVLMRQILPMILGFPLGLLILNTKNFINLFYFLQPRLVFSEVLLALGIEILFVSAAVLPFRFLPKFRTPHELFRKD